MQPGEQAEGVLTATPTHVGRASRVGYFGFATAEFGDLWPLLGGIVISIGLLMEIFLGGGLSRSPVALRIVVAIGPALAGYGYLRFLVEGRPPHFKGDLLETLRSARLDLSDPPFPMIAIVPRIRIEIGLEPDLPGGRQPVHPLARLDRRQEHGR